MKVTFYLPAHPSYFDNRYTQQEIDQGIRDLDWFYGGVIFKGNRLPTLQEQFLLLREPGKAVVVHFDGSGPSQTKPLADGQESSGIDECHQTSNTRLSNMVTTLKALMDGNRGHRRKKGGRR